MGLYKKCEVCGTNINKLQNLFNVYFLRVGAKLKCPNCGTEYKTNKFIIILGEISLFWIWIIPILLIVRFIDSFNLHLGIEVWFYAFIILSIVEFMGMVILPLNKVEDKKEGE